MTPNVAVTTVLLPIGLGLLGFVEPCTLGTTLVFVGFLESKSARRKLVETIGFALTRAVTIGLFGMLAAFLGSLFLGVQKDVWIALGSLYAILGLLVLTGQTGRLMVALGPSLARLSNLRGSLGLGVLFGFNIPSCAAPLVLALLGTVAAGGADGRPLAVGFLSLALFGLVLSLPLVVAVLFAPARRAIDWLGGLSRRMPIITGLVLIAVGLWSIWFGLFVSIRHPMPGMGMPGMRG
ncbi:cytochrome c biogenesis protein CcdA [Acidiphilium iwatense]|uniref:Cytochrome C biogenesis protein transmembrane domain-containing protein n=1 Tax=Acidiphilium iwatense TaxID=768198 RepID=A0ABS9DZY6_9PROT|nr:cytochrome c biogenesis protein CcdA [Acidiphilium iwatense]MCF3946904.1 hypothetical protein [Acidiphilium iwatense]